MLEACTSPRAAKLLVLLLVLHASIATAQEVELRWERLADIPDSVGLASPFAGTVGSALVVAGGANFPDQPPWLGGTKVWHDRVWIMDTPDSSWRETDPLSKPSAYGVSISTKDGLICVGGSDSERHFSDVSMIQLKAGQIITKSLPSLPRPIANACGALVGSTVYVAGGSESTTSTSALHLFLALDLANITQGWKELSPWPGPGRILSVCSVIGEHFYLVSGADLSPDPTGKPLRKYLTDAYRFHPSLGWTRLPDIPQACVAAPSPAPSLTADSFAILGGDDGTKVGVMPIEKHPGFAKSIQVFDVANNKWNQFGYTPAPRVTVTAVKWNDRYLIASGEERPGVRSPQVWSFTTISPK